MGLGQCSAAIHCSYILAYKNSKVSRGDLVFVEEREQMHSCSTSDHRGVAWTKLKALWKETAQSLFNSYVQWKKEHEVNMKFKENYTY